MKKSMNILRFAAVLAAGMAIFACQKVKETYEPATPEQGDRVYFMSEPTGTVKLVKESPSISIVVGRNSSAAALDAPLTVSGDATQYFNVPTKVSFAAGESKKSITVDVKDINTIPVNNFFDLSMKVDDSLASAYGLSALSFKIGIELPWIKFDTGTMVEGWWGETEPEMPMQYQQITPNMRYCVVEGCWGHDTGEGYPVQPYVWYWNTETNQCYIPPQFMGYSTSSGDVWIGDEPAFYNFYYYGAKGDGYVMKNMTLPVVAEAGTDAWFAFCDEMRSVYPDDYYPYYDGAGKFYLADYFYLVDTAGTGYPTGSGYQFGAGKVDTYVCSFAADYTIGFSYDGIFTDKDGVVFAVASVSYETKDVKDVALVLVEGKDPEAANEIIENEESAQVVFISAAGTYNIPMPENAEDGFYTVVALPLNGDGEPQWDFAMYETFGYGNLDPLYLDYTSSDFVAGVSKDVLLETTWLAYAAPYGTSAADRAACALVTFADAEDNEAGDDLITCSGLGNSTAFGDTFVMEYYQGVIYFLAAQEISDYSGYAVVASTYSDEEAFGGNYTMCGAYVGEDMIAFVNNSKSDFYYGFAFWAVGDDGIAGYLRAREYLMLVPYVPEEEAAGAPKRIQSHVSINEVQIPYRFGMDAQRDVVPSYDWSKDVVAGGRVYSVKSDVVVKNINVR